MRSLAALATVLVLLPSAAFADEVDLSHTAGRRGGGTPPELVIRFEGGTEFSPYGYAGGVLSWMVGPNFELDGGVGAGFPGLQIGVSGRTIFPVSDDGKYLLAELSIAGNTRKDLSSTNAGNPTFVGNQSSLWTGLGFGAELRRDFYSIDVVGQLVLTTQDLTPHFCVHGGVGFGF